ncbi:NAD-dependent epimerase/dehydratase family protein [Agrobacterium vitis]|uniref:NAD-dependent epimerase/dehydratase family protein n=1 Tax=Agrobacterium vitis TaxID=373 RepID=UPI0008726239|nr:NAD(P)-dependent oxidoreductase [Agrobacterium vitis]MCE6075724.1 NAD-dependent epimerase/dehydratase family protein [Agrobacterium vitis]MCM2468202.1 NAD(P)-dependent oxidoreductase [Agrobacterium vitis]MUO70334.1 NAD-dependent epimerase/dehydratase family protein [Agrobacterium vitis]MUO82475.1 NAD-dependent epimerase/dehydratase family protein [Agrobacterium vitis]MVA34739.1 NAD-dependent epimerase/dehydratase family protein [Agrobacterium vitis]
MNKRIVFTGCTGKAGRHAVPHLQAKGYSILNLDLKPLDCPGVNTLITDITDSGQVFNALTTHFGFDGYDHGAPPSAPDAVVHFAAIPRVMIEPDNCTFSANVVGTYNVIEAAMKLGVRKVIIASSETTYGVCFAEGDKDFHSFPLEEDYDSDPMDSYGLSKVVNEKTARAFAMRYKADIYALRIGNVIEPHDYTNFPGYLDNPMSRKRNAWSYIDARDLGEIVHLCIEKDGLGFQVFNAVNDTITADLPTREFLAKYCPDTPVLREMGENEAPISNRKAREVLGFKEEHPWRKYVTR